MTPLTQQLEDKKKELNECELYTKWDKDVNKTEQNKLISDSLNIKLESKEYKDLDVEQQCSLIMTKIAEIAILEQAIAEIQKQRQEEIEFLQWIYSNNGVEEDFDNVMISIDNRINRLKEQQLNQPKTER